MDVLQQLRNDANDKIEKWTLRGNQGWVTSWIQEQWKKNAFDEGFFAGIHHAIKLLTSCQAAPIITVEAKKN